MKKAASAFLVLALACSGAQSGHKPKISADAASTDALASQQVVVQWNIPIGDATAALITSVGGKVISEFNSVRQGVYLVPGSGLVTLSSDPSVKYISADRKVKRKLATTAATINAPQVWNA